MGDFLAITACVTHLFRPWTVDDEICLAFVVYYGELLHFRDRDIREMK
jgi:hypothetical protein